MKFTVLMMMPYDWHSDQGCAADCVLREWVEAETVENATAQAQAQAVAIYEEDTNVEPDDFAVIAVYPGHHLDMFQP
jgi:hypothetical protein